MATVKGFDMFLAHFKGFEEQYVLIGGAACSVWLSHRDVEFRMTKDLDLVLVVESLVPAFTRRLWDFITVGGYRTCRLQNGRKDLARFLACFPAESPDWHAIRRSIGTDSPVPSDLLAHLRTVFGLHSSSPSALAPGFRPTSA